MTLKIQTGIYKGKSIPAVASKGKSNYTPALLKKSVFSIADSALEENNTDYKNSTFVDLFAGSGQMGFEACSKGYTVHMNEIDNQRFGIIRDFSVNLGAKNSVVLHRKNAFRFILPKINGLLVCFLDPPYTFWSEKEKIENLLARLITENPEKFLLMVQSPVDGGLEKMETRKFGNNYLLVYKSWKTNDDT